METTSNIISREGLLEASKKEDWGKLHLILVAHCIKRFLYRYGIKESNEELLVRSNTLISEVHSLMLVEGKRNWNTDKYNTFKDFIISVIDSHLNNELNKSNSREQPTDEIIDSTHDPSPEDEITYIEYRNEVFAFLENDGATDDEIMVFECMADGIVKPKAIREELGISEEDFHNIWRRLKIRIKKLRET